MNKKLAIAALAASPLVLHAQEKKETPKAATEIPFSIKGIFGEDHPYSATLGFTLLKSPNTLLMERVEVPLIETEQVKQALRELVIAEAREKGKPIDNDETKIAAAIETKKKTVGVPVWDKEKGLKFLKPEEYEKHRLTSSLRMYRAEEKDELDKNGKPTGKKVKAIAKDSNDKPIEEGSAILFGIRDSFSRYNYSQEGLAFDYSNSNGNDSMVLKGAIISDIYWGALYNNEGIKAPWNNDHYRFSIKTGVEFNTDEVAKKEVDQTSVYLLANFQANPDLDAHMFAIKDWFQITSPQFLQVGAAWDHDDLTGTDDLRWIVDWQPRFYLLNDRSWIARSIGINTLMRFDKDKYFSLNKNPTVKEKATPNKAALVGDRSESPDGKADLAPDESPWYTYIPADVKLAGGSDIWDTLSGGREDLDKTTLEWKLGLIVGNSDWAFRAGYLAEGVSAVSDLGGTHIGHSIFAEVGLGNFTGKIAGQEVPNETPLPKADIGAATLFAKYKFGERAPDFKNEDLFQVGLRMRF
ncbi:hypothetical protein [Luteolibacter soli]|uniref:Porin n=1 Tax=Luteolibacter soli TaxID=3135280 RepID=A0ABU9AV67_9BACT